MLLVSKQVASNVASRAEQLGATPSVRAARKLPGFDAAELALRERATTERQVRETTVEPTSSEGLSGGRLTPSAW